MRDSRDDATASLFRPLYRQIIIYIAMRLSPSLSVPGTARPTLLECGFLFLCGDGMSNKETVMALSVDSFGLIPLLHLYSSITWDALLIMARSHLVVALR